MQWFGMHGSAYGNWAVDECDLLLGLGVRFDDRVTGDTQKFAPKARIVHLDIDASEHNKNKRVEFPIQSDIKVRTWKVGGAHEGRQVRPAGNQSLARARSPNGSGSTRSVSRRAGTSSPRRP